MPDAPSHPGLGREAADAASRVGDHPWLERVARLGFVASGLIHLLIGWIAARVALGGSGDQADQSGALESLREAPGGAVLLWVCVVGFAALALWQAIEALVGADELTDRAKAVGKAVLYGALGATTLVFALGGSKDSEETSTDLTATLLELPWGRFLVGAVGLGVLGAGAFHVYRGWSRSFLDDLVGTGGGTVGKGVEVSGVVGFVAKGIALGVMGVLFLVAALRADPEEASGLDGALRTLAEQPLGTWLLLAVALGLVLYGVYSFARARYDRF